ncbi:hypothetical protein PJ311_16740 [Bacillus sp. CLL-7-23]|uniref:Uncharacterized protein n=1 Tax=Bacillus changyiensis TaxID=3004103 RepID=A0ABT4X7E6_9BACI|nr:hypothetical protein [Bacillus changyiensis]
MNNKVPTKTDVKAKLAEIQGIPEDSLPMKKVIDILKGYQADGIMNERLKKS